MCIRDSHGAARSDTRAAVHRGSFVILAVDHLDRGKGIIRGLRQRHQPYR
jgi:hypothetical protein